uniref:Uncharacterized protein n=1 Tax=Avena sativa TaxID=4498 RepID=A0ACD5YC86_AVESA
MTTPRSQFRSLLLLLLLLSSVIFAGATEEQQPMVPRQSCLDKCGKISIPFPFGIGPGCFREGFEVLYNHSRAFLADDRISYFTPSSPMTEQPLELVSISVATGEARAYVSVSSRCHTNVTAAFSTGVVGIIFSRTPFAVSLTRNVLTGVGMNAEPELAFDPDVASVSCRAYSYDYPGTKQYPTDGSCSGRGCCEAALPPDVGPTQLFALSLKEHGGPNNEWRRNPCNYGMLVERSWYNFSTADTYNRTLLRRFPKGVAVALDFAAGNDSCPVKGQPPPPDYACVSDNSFCANATLTPGYICKCQEHYAGNPYVPNGCKDIDECKLPQKYRCSSGICRNKPGGYDCPCKFGMKGDAKEGICTHVFTPAAKATVGAIGGVFLMVILLLLVILHKEKKKMKEFYKKNGGPTLERANVIKLFKKGDLKHIIKNSNLIGKGCFGEVYKGLLDSKLVAIKKPINGTVLESDQFANEVIIQSQVIHKNIVRLIGCCLEVDAPMLVYEFISQGSLHDILHNNNNKVALNLDARVSIAAQSADGLAYMHSKANIIILHGDVKPANILLDDNFVPKISDFGISRLIARDKEHTRFVIGDMNYMDPVYLQEGLLTEKSDVYSFGVVILELISCKRAIHSGEIHSGNNSLVKSFLEAHKKHKKVIDLFDKEIAVTKDLDLLNSLAGMAVECLSLDVDQRPTMMEIAERLLTLSRSRKV